MEDQEQEENTLIEISDEEASITMAAHKINDVATLKRIVKDINEHIEALTASAIHGHHIYDHVIFLLRGKAKEGIIEGVTKTHATISMITREGADTSIITIPVKDICRKIQ